MLKNASRSAPVLLALVLAALVGVASTQNQARAEKRNQAKIKVPASGEGLWKYLKSENYENNWSLWPGKKTFYPGSRPHGALLTTYVNHTALKSIVNKKGKMANGSIVVKENYTPQKELAAITVMYKAKGFNPKERNWFWAKYGPDGKVEAAGKINSCIQCHGEQKANDFIWTESLK